MKRRRKGLIVIRWAHIPEPPSDAVPFETPPVAADTPIELVAILRLDPAL